MLCAYIKRKDQETLLKVSEFYVTIQSYWTPLNDVYSERMSAKYVWCFKVLHFQNCDI